MPQSCNGERKMQVEFNSEIGLDELDLDEFLSPAHSRLHHVPVDLDTAQVLEEIRAGSARRTGPSSHVLLWRLVKCSGPLLGADVISLLLAGLFAQGVARLLDHGTPMTGWAATAALLPLIAAYWLGGLYAVMGVHPVVEIRQVFQLNSIALGAGAIGALAVPGLPTWCVAAWFASALLVPLTRSLVRGWCAAQRWWGHPALIISSGNGCDDVAALLVRAPSAGLRPIAITDPRGECESASIPVINDPAAVETLVGAEAIRHAVIWMPELPHADLAPILDRYRRLVPHLLITSDSAALPSLWGASRSCGALSATHYSNGWLLAPLRLVKRTLDIAVALVALLIGAPVLIVIALLVKLGSRGPVLYAHTRIGVNGRRFAAWKFRTMYIDGDNLLQAYLRIDRAARAEWQRDQKLRDDPRVTRIGNFLRRWSLDELPQIWNVLRGDMSVVGPRPIVNAEAERYGDVFSLYTSVKPGITGLWQVSGRNDTTYAERVRFDAYYVRNWSPWLDVYILARTLVVLLRRTGAY